MATQLIRSRPHGTTRRLGALVLAHIQQPLPSPPQIDTQAPVAETPAINRHSPLSSALLHSREASTHPTSFSISSQHRWGAQHSLALNSSRGLSSAAAPMSAPDTWTERTYARNLDQYIRVLRVLMETNRAFLMRDVYEDMTMDGFFPNREGWHCLIVGCKRQRRLQDTLFFFEEMKRRGIPPDLVLYNCVIDSCGVAGYLNQAFKMAEELEVVGLKPSMRTYISLLSACGVAGRVEEALGVVQRMKSQGLTLNKFCYSALISAYKNTLPVQEESKAMVFELLNQARAALKAEREQGRLTKDDSGAGYHEEKEAPGEGGGVDLAVRDLGLSTVHLQDKEQVFYRAALRAMVHWRDTKGAARVLEMLREDGMEPDAYSKVLFVQMQILTRNMVEAQVQYDELVNNQGLVPSAKFQVAMMAGAVQLYNEEGFALAKRFLAEFEQRGLYLSSNYGAHLLRLAARDFVGDFSCARVFFRHILENTRPPRRISPMPGTIDFFIKSLIRRGVPEDDPDLLEAHKLLSALRPSQYKVTKEEKPEVDASP